MDVAGNLVLPVVVTSLEQANLCGTPPKMGCSPKKVPIGSTSLVALLTEAESSKSRLSNILITRTVARKLLLEYLYLDAPYRGLYPCNVASITVT